MKQLLLFTIFALLAGVAFAAPPKYTVFQYEAAHLKANQRHLQEHKRCVVIKNPGPCLDVNDAKWRKDQAKIYARKVGTPHARAEATRIIREQDARMRDAGLIP